MNLLNKGAHTHYSQQEKRDESPNRYAELSAYIKTTMETAVAKIESMKGQVTSVVLDRVGEKIVKAEKDMDQYLIQLRQTTQQMKGEIELLADSYKIVPGHEYTAGNVWDTGNTYNDHPIKGCFVRVNTIGSYETTLTSLPEDFQSGVSTIVNWNFWAFAGSSRDFAFNPDTLKVRYTGTNTAATHKAQLEIFYIVG